MTNKQEYLYFNAINMDSNIYILKNDGYLYKNGTTKITSVGNIKMFYGVYLQGIILTNDGKVYTTTNDFSTATLISSLSDKHICWVAGGYRNGFLAITEDNQLYVWGANTRGALGVGHSNSVPSPTLVTLPNNEKPFMAVSSDESTAIITKTGNVYVAGYLIKTHTSGTVTYNTFTKSDISNVTHMSMGCDSINYMSMYAITADGKAYVIGTASPGKWTQVNGISNARFTLGCDSDSVAGMVDNDGNAYYVSGTNATKLNNISSAIANYAQKSTIICSTSDGKIYSGGYTSPSLNSTYSSNAAKAEIKIDGLFVALPSNITNSTYTTAPNKLTYYYQVKFIQTDQITETSNVVNYETTRILSVLRKILIINILYKLIRYRNF